ncbi:MAG: hypothetical protein M3238_07075 [Actinomycetota bacterium]|nr:hypothetical protein [Actinomycetota bacterium]
MHPSSPGFDDKRGVFSSSGDLPIYDAPETDVPVTASGSRIVLVCCYCSRARTGQHWIHLQQLAERSTGIELSHGVCPACVPRARQPIGVSKPLR